MAKKKNNKIIVYTSKGCKYCEEIKLLLKEKKIDFVEKDTRENIEEWSKASAFTNLPSTPTIYFKNNYFVPGRDFQNSEHVVNIIENFEESTFDTIEIINERIKTLNYNIAMAFSRLEQSLSRIESQTNLENKLNTEENVNKSTN